MTFEKLVNEILRPETNRAASFVALSLVFASECRDLDMFYAFKSRYVINHSSEWQVVGYRWIRLDLGLNLNGTRAPSVSKKITATNDD